MFWMLNEHSKVTPIMNETRDPQFKLLVILENQRVGGDFGALPSEFARSNSSLHFLIADWLVTREAKPAKIENTKNFHANCSKHKVSGFGFLAIFSRNVIERPSAPPDRVSIHLSYRPLTSSSAESYDIVE